MEGGNEKEMQASVSRGHTTAKWETSSLGKPQRGQAEDTAPRKRPELTASPPQPTRS